MTTLSTNILGIDFENPFLLASAPPTAQIESIDKAFSMGWGPFPCLRNRHVEAMQKCSKIQLITIQGAIIL